MAWYNLIWPATILYGPLLSIYVSVHKQPITSDTLIRVQFLLSNNTHQLLFKTFSNIQRSTGNKYLTNCYLSIRILATNTHRTLHIGGGNLPFWYFTITRQIYLPLLQLILKKKKNRRWMVATTSAYSSGWIINAKPFPV